MDALDKVLTMGVGLLERPLNSCFLFISLLESKVIRRPYTHGDNSIIV